MISDPIFKRDTNGKIRIWKYEVLNDSFRIVAGLQNGNFVVSKWTICKPKNEGKTNATTASEQALLEAQAEETKKLKREYRRTITELDSVPMGPMLARNYADLKKPLAFPVYSQPKLDGIRAIINRHGAFSRELQPHFNCDHILEILDPIFLFYPDAVFDGEFYNHDLKNDFNKIVSVVRKQSPTEEQREEAKQLLQYHIYDMPSDKPFSERYADMKFMLETYNLSEGQVRIVGTNSLSNQEQLDKLYGSYIELGYEGQMVRLDEPYDFDIRSKFLLKRKEFKTEEFKVSRIIEGLGNWSGVAKAVEFILPNDKRLENGERPRAGIRGSREFAKKLLDDANSGIVPEEVTIRFFDYTPYGIPRFPVAIDFHLNGRND